MWLHERDFSMAIPVNTQVLYFYFCFIFQSSKVKPLLMQSPLTKSDYQAPKSPVDWKTPNTALIGSAIKHANLVTSRNCSPQSQNPLVIIFNPMGESIHTKRREKLQLEMILLIEWKSHKVVGGGRSPICAYIVLSQNLEPYPSYLS